MKTIACSTCSHPVLLDDDMADKIGVSSITCGYGAGIYCQKQTLASFVMGPHGFGRVWDHIDRNSHNNQRSNLRVATISQNNINAAKRTNSGGRGLTFCKGRGLWQAQIRIDGKKVNLGRYATKEQAAEVYNNAAKLHHKEFAILNENAIRVPTQSKQ